ncbi:MAG: PD40 domain-containing protein [Ignavibacteriales bacterium]|nr:PD40 domain-containing protein [Ignavibacteriales bacterium]MBI3787504.1 PD40 domain-containing protein [Ignavibacteriales bacterium]
MSRISTILFFLIINIAGSFSFSQELKPYAHKEQLKQPIEFAPGIISTGLEFDLSFTPDGREAYFVRADTVRKLPVIHVSRFENGKWQTPNIASFSGHFNDVDPLVTYDGNKLFFGSKRPLANTETTPKKDHDIWWVERNGSEWSEPKHAGSEVNSSGKEGWPYVVHDVMFFFSDQGGGTLNSNHLYTAQWIQGRWATTKKLDAAVNSDSADFCPAVSPDGNLMIFYSTRAGGFGGGDLYYSRKIQGTWSAAKNLGEMVNTKDWEVCPSFSPDGKYLFFTRNRRIYQIDIAALGL